MARKHKLNQVRLGPRFLTCNSFFSGIGGIELGFEQAGIATTFQCETDTFCREILARHWPQLEAARDIKKVRPRQIPDADIWCGGFPCQDVSVARGSLARKGLRGEHSGLFYPLIWLVRPKLPRVIFIENVQGLLNSHEGSDFAIILESLSSMGYGIAWRLLNSRYFGVPQSRPRLYLCAWLDCPDLAIKALFEESVPQKPRDERAGFLKVTQDPKSGAIVPEVAYCLAATSGRHTGTDWSRSYVSYRDVVRRLTPTEYERLQGFPDGWTLPIDIGGLSADNLDTFRYKALGNAVSVPVIKWIGRRIVDAFFARRVLEEDALSGQGLARLLIGESSPETYDVRSGCLSCEDEPMERGKCWQNSGAAYHGFWVSADIPASPCKPVTSRFIAIIERQRVDERYYLSPNAAEGIMRRVESQRRKLFRPLEEALRHLAAKKQLCS